MSKIDNRYISEVLGVGHGGSARPRALLRTCDLLIRLHVPALGNSYELVTCSLKCFDDVRNDDVRSFLVNFMIQSQDGAGVLLDEIIVSFVALGGSRPSRVAGVEVPCDEFLSALVGDLAYEIVVVAVRRPQERRRDAEQTLEGLFDSPELVVDLVEGKSGEVLMIPGVRSDHVPLTVGVFHTFHIDRIVDTTVVVTIPEECAFGTSRDQCSRYVVNVLFRSVVECQRDGVRDLALRDQLCEGCSTASERFDIGKWGRLGCGCGGSLYHYGRGNQGHSSEQFRQHIYEGIEDKRVIV
jgi:hypothetical protein